MALTVLLAMALGYLAWRDLPQSGSPQPDSRQPGLATDDFLQQLGRALVSGTRLGELAATVGARRELTGLAENLDRLGVTGLSLRYVGESRLRPSAAQQQRLGEDAWVCDVRLMWQFRGVDLRPSTLVVPLVLTSDDGDVAFVATGLHDGLRAPLWWQDRVAVRRTAGTLVLSPDRIRARAVERAAVQAVAVVRRTLPRWRELLVIEAAATGAQFRAASGIPAESAKALAAATTTADGSVHARSPRHIYVNPKAYDSLGAVGQQIVLSHEAAHVALDADTSRAPLWLTEGIADYVALVGSDFPEAEFAAQLRVLVGEDGVPRRLPGPAELDGANEDVGAWYEAAWLAVRLIAERHGEPALFDFYDAVDRGVEPRAAFRTVLGTRGAKFLRDWRAALARLAD